MDGTKRGRGRPRSLDPDHKKFTIEVEDDTIEGLIAYIDSEGKEGSMSSVMRMMLRDSLTRRGFLRGPDSRAGSMAARPNRQPAR